MYAEFVIGTRKNNVRAWHGYVCTVLLPFGGKVMGVIQVDMAIEK